MILSAETKEEIMDVHKFYKRKSQLADIDFFKKILTIIQEEQNFKGLYEYKFVNGKKKFPYAYVDKRTGIAMFDFELIMKQMKKIHRVYPKYPLVYIGNFFVIYTILHESSHVWQKKGLEAYSEINRLHNDIMTIRQFALNELLMFYINIKKMDSHLYYERQAHIDACREIIDMYQDSVLTDMLRYGDTILDMVIRNYIKYLSYKPKGESIVHDTLAAHFLKYNYNCEGIPQYLLFEVGLPTTKKYSDSVYEALDMCKKGSMCFEDVMERIRKC